VVENRREYLRRRGFYNSTARLSQWKYKLYLLRREIIIIIAKTTIFEPKPSLEDSAIFPAILVCRESDHQVFTSLDFATIFRARSSAVRAIPNLEDQVSVFMSPSDRVVHLYRQAFVAFYDLQGDGGSILTGLHTGNAVSTSGYIHIYIYIYIYIYSPMTV
jgi:hypothetical protein